MLELFALSVMHNILPFYKHHYFYISFLVFLQKSFEKTSAEKDAIIAEKDSQIVQSQAKIDDMKEQFKEMLQTTLEKLTEKIQSGGEWSEELLPDKKLLEATGVHI